MRKRSVTLKGHRTSIALEPEFWAALERFAAADGVSLALLVSRVDRDRLKRAPPPGLASALRVHVLNRLQQSDAGQSSPAGLTSSTTPLTPQPARRR